jgi:UDP-N-acetylglucosamine--N-acetylmuramyl-(pentapeptide) pyrophosphoryl-undecaprenol N-acetylglucosamine transferase
MKVLITGGHFSPAYSVIQELKSRGHELLIVGRIHPFEGQKLGESLEYRVSKELKIPFFELTTGRLQRKLSWHTIPSLVKFIKGIIEAQVIMKRHKPDIVVTFGGYIALPVAIAAKIYNLPVVTHEQTLGIGLSNKSIARFSDAVCISFESTKQYITHKNLILTGNPLRPEIYTVIEKLEYEKSLPLLYVTGGSTGSHAINSAVHEVLKDILQKYSVIHQTGENDFKDYEKSLEIKNSLPQELQSRYQVVKYVYPPQIGYVYKNTSLLIGRSGANTVLELVATNTPALLIPLPHGQKGEQQKNAEWIQSLGLAEILPQSQLNSKNLIEAISTMQNAIAKYTITKDIINKYIFDDAAKKIVDVITAVYEKKKNNS